MQGPEFIPLARAAAMAHERLFPDRPTKDSKLLDLLALALSDLVPLYQRDMESGALRALEEAEIASGRFTRGATTLEYRNRPPLRFLVVSLSELDAALPKLAQEMPDSLKPRALNRRTQASTTPASNHTPRLPSISCSAASRPSPAR